MSKLNQENIQRARAFAARRPVRVASAVAALASKWGALFVGAPGVDPAQVIADQVAQVVRVNQAAQL